MRMPISASVISCLINRLHKIDRGSQRGKIHCSPHHGRQRVFVREAIILRAQKIIDFTTKMWKWTHSNLCISNKNILKKKKKKDAPANKPQHVPLGVVAKKKKIDAFLQNMAAQSGDASMPAQLGETYIWSRYPRQDALRFLIDCRV